MLLLTMLAFAEENHPFLYGGFGVNVGTSDWSGVNATYAEPPQAPEVRDEAMGEFGSFGGLSLGYGVAKRFWFIDFGLSRGRTARQTEVTTDPRGTPPRTKTHQVQLRPQLAWTAVGLGYENDRVFVGVGVGGHGGRIRDASWSSDTWDPDHVSSDWGGGSNAVLLGSLEGRLAIAFGEFQIALQPSLINLPKEYGDRMLRVAVFIGPSSAA